MLLGQKIDFEELNIYIAASISVLFASIFRNIKWQVSIMMTKV